MKRVLHAVLALVISAAALTYALMGIDTSHLIETVGNARLWVIGPTLALIVLFYLFTGLRWNLILRPLGRFTLAQSGPAMMIGFAGNNLLPAHLGEFVRTAVFARRYELPAAAVFVTLVLERVFDVFAILFLYAIAIAAISPFPGSLRLGAEALAIAVAVLCLGIVAFLRYPGFFLRLWDASTRWLPHRLAPLRTRGHRLIQHVADGLVALRSPKATAAMFAYSLLKWIACGGIVWLSVRAFGTTIPFTVTLVVNAVVALAVTVPTAPGFVGTLQAAFVLALMPFGIDQETAVAASVLMLAIQWPLVTVFGAGCFVAMGLRVTEVKAETRRVESEAVSD